MMPKEYGMTCKVIERWYCKYNRFHSYACPHKGCLNKKRNGRCGLQMCRLESDEKNNLTGRCLDFKKELQDGEE